MWADRVAVEFEGSTTTYAGLMERVERVAGGLRDLGVGAGDRVAALMPNVPAMLELHYSVPGSGAVLVPLNTRLSEAEYEYILRNSGARWLVATEEFAEVASAVISRLGGKCQLLLVGAGSPYEEMATAANRLDLGVEDEFSLMSINYTSGTTGRPKGVMYTHRGSYLHALGVIAEAKIDTSSGFVWTLPMFHCHGWAFTWAITAVGGRHQCMRSVDLAVVWRFLSEGSSHLCAAPTVLTMLVDAPEAQQLERPVSVFVGGAPPTPALLERARDLGLQITHLYGLTETYGPLAVCAWNPDWNHLPVETQARLRARQGVASIVTEPLRVVDDRMHDVPPDGETIGEVVMKGNNVTPGYYSDGDATEAAFRGGWFHSGDLAVMHPDGHIELRDRLKDIIISGGENISTIEVEQALAAHPSVLEVAVVGIPDAHWGEAVMAFVVCRQRGGVTALELQEFARKRLARFKVPKAIEFVDALPKTATGKIQKFVLRASVEARNPTPS